MGLLGMIVAAEMLKKQGYRKRLAPFRKEVDFGKELGYGHKKTKESKFIRSDNTKEVRIK